MTQELEKTEFLDPTVDCIFKGVMLDPDNLDYIKGFIHFILGVPYENLGNLKIENSEYVVNNKKDKNMRSDIVVTVDNKNINLEMDRSYYKGILLKNSAYHHKIAASMFDSGEDYVNGRVSIQIIFQNFNHFKNEQEVYKFIYKEETTNERLYDEEIDTKYVINLEKIRELCYNKSIEELSDFEKYCLLLVTTDKDKSYKISKGDSVMEKVSKRLENLSNDDKMIGVYNAEIQEEKIKRTIELSALKKGIEQGIEQGMEKGAKNKAVEIAKNMLKETNDLEFISRVTDLSIEKIKELI